MSAAERELAEAIASDACRTGHDDTEAAAALIYATSKPDDLDLTGEQEDRILNQVFDLIQELCPTPQSVRTSSANVSPGDRQTGADQFGRVTFCDYYGTSCTADHEDIARDYCTLKDTYGAEAAADALMVAAADTGDSDMPSTAMAIAVAADLAECKIR